LSARSLIIAAVIVAGVALTHQIRPLNVLAYSLLALLVVSYVWSRFSVRGLRLQRHVRARRVQAGETLEEHLILHNASLAPRYWLQVQDHSTLPGHAASRVVDLAPGETRSWSVHTVCRRRGEYFLGPASLVGADPLGLFSARRRVGQATRLLVYPQTVALLDLTFPFATEQGGRRQRPGWQQTTPDAVDTREYTPGDPWRRIHWKTTARLAKLMVKEFDDDPAADVWLFLDLEARVQQGVGEESTLEYGVKAAASLAKHFLDRNQRVGLVASARRQLVLPADRGDRQLWKVLEELAVAQADGDTPLSEVLLAEGHCCRGRAVALIITPSLEEEWVATLRTLRPQGVRAAAILLEPATFGGSEPSLLLIGALAAAEVPLLLVKQGDDLSLALRGNGHPGVVE